MSTARLLRNTVRDQKDWKTVAFKQFHFFDPTGREVDDTGLGKMLGEINPLTLIDPAYWQASHFTFTFFDSTANEQPHTYVDQRSGLPEYTDLQVNRAEANFNLAKRFCGA